jgi:hypothetical protein
MDFDLLRSISVPFWPSVGTIRRAGWVEMSALPQAHEVDRKYLRLLVQLLLFEPERVHPLLLPHATIRINLEHVRRENIERAVEFTKALQRRSIIRPYVSLFGTCKDALSGAVRCDRI